jgi:bacteriorhodopsin
MGLFSRANDALDVNPTVGADIAITIHGSDWYWAVTAVMILSTIIFIGMSFTVPRRNRVFHYITASITMVASIAYFSMASNLGYTGILVEFTPHLDGTFREIFYVRYIDWAITTPVS